MVYPLRHISIRVPWHDTGWEGRVCTAPKLNGSCLKLKRIAEQRADDAEDAIKGQSIQDLPENRWPVCVPERAVFMAPFEYLRMANHPYNRGPESSHDWDRFHGAKDLAIGVATEAGELLLLRGPETNTYFKSSVPPLPGRTHLINPLRE